jgi:hypothetical protein
MTKQEFRALKSLKVNKDIRIFQADKGNCTAVLDESEYRNKINHLLDSGVYQPLSKDPTKTVERKVQKLLSKHKAAFPTDLKRKLTPHHSKPPYLYGFPEIHKPGVPLRPTVSSIGSPCYSLAGFLLKILNPLVGKPQSFVKNPGHFIKLLKPINLQPLDILVSLSTNAPVDATLQVSRNKLHNDHTLTEQSSLEVEDIMELLDVCLTTTYFQVDDKFFQQKDGMTMGNALSPVVSNIFMEHFEELVLRTPNHRPFLWLRYVDDTFVIWPHGPDRSQEFFDHINNLRPSVQLSMETEADSKIPFLDVLLIKKQLTMTTTMYRKSSHTCRYLNSQSNHPPHVKFGSCTAGLPLYVRNDRIWPVK